jgi:hypothetical protein
MLSSMEGNVHNLNEGPFVLDAESSFVLSTSPTFHLGKLGLALGRKALPYTHNYLKWHRPTKYLMF